jgi:small subunit ribosomal protein S18e
MSTSKIQFKTEKDFRFILRIFNTNIDGKQKIPYALRSVRGIGRRFALLITQKAELNPNDRAGDLSEQQLEKLVDICQNPLNYGIPQWFLNRKKDPKEGTFTQQIANGIDTKLRDDLEKMKRMRLHKGLRHYFGLKVRGQHMCSTGRRGKTVGVEKKKTP